jgi:hypothetical protein
MTTTPISMDDVLDAATQTRYPTPTQAGERYSPHWALARLGSNGDTEVLA